MASPFIVVRDGAGRPLPEVDRLRGAVVAIGNFDGVHRGHRSVIATALRRARERGVPAAALTLEPHPRVLFRPELPLFRLSDEAQKLRLLATTGLDGAVVLHFDRILASVEAKDFIAEFLLQRLGVSGVAMGFDFHFGKNRGGSPDFLAAEGERLGFSVDIVPALEDEGRPVSSGSIRSALVNGQVVEAAELLGFPWFVTGAVIGGDKRGRALGYPTANIRLPASCGLKHGIYAVRVGIDGRRYGGVASFGTRPTFDDGAPLLEVFVFDFSGDLYGKVLDVALIAWIRPELKFDGIAALVRRIDDDCRQAKAALARAGDAFPPI